MVYSQFAILGKFGGVEKFYAHCRFLRKPRVNCPRMSCERGSKNVFFNQNERVSKGEVDEAQRRKLESNAEKAIHFFKNAASILSKKK